MAKVQIGLNGPKAKKWKFKAVLFDNETLWLDSEGMPTQRVDAAPHEAENIHSLLREGRRRRELYENGAPKLIQSLEYVPAE